MEQEQSYTVGKSDFRFRYWYKAVLCLKYLTEVLHITELSNNEPSQQCQQICLHVAITKKLLSIKHQEKADITGKDEKSQQCFPSESSTGVDNKRPLKDNRTCKMKNCNIYCVIGQMNTAILHWAPKEFDRKSFDVYTDIMMSVLQMVSQNSNIDVSHITDKIVELKRTEFDINSKDGRVALMVVQQSVDEKITERQLLGDNLYDMLQQGADIFDDHTERARALDVTKSNMKVENLDVQQIPLNLEIECDNLKNVPCSELGREVNESKTQTDDTDLFDKLKRYEDIPRIAATETAKMMNKTQLAVLVSIVSEDAIEGHAKMRPAGKLKNKVSNCLPLFNTSKDSLKINFTKHTCVEPTVQSKHSFAFHWNSARRSCVKLIVHPQPEGIFSEKYFTSCRYSYDLLDEIKIGLLKKCRFLSTDVYTMALIQNCQFLTQLNACYVQCQKESAENKKCKLYTKHLQLPFSTRTKTDVFSMQSKEPFQSLYRVIEYDYLLFHLLCAQRTVDCFEISVTDFKKLYISACLYVAINPLSVLDAWVKKLTFRSIDNEKHCLSNSSDLCGMGSLASRKCCKVKTAARNSDLSTCTKDVIAFNGPGVSLHPVEETTPTLTDSQEVDMSQECLFTDTIRKAMRNSTYLQETRAICKRIYGTVNLKTRQEVGDFQLNNDMEERESEEKSDLVREIVTGNVFNPSAHSTYVVAPVSKGHNKMSSSGSESQSGNADNESLHATGIETESRVEANEEHNDGENGAGANKAEECSSRKHAEQISMDGHKPPKTEDVQIDSCKNESLTLLRQNTSLPAGVFKGENSEEVVVAHAKYAEHPGACGFNRNNYKETVIVQSSAHEERQVNDSRTTDIANNTSIPTTELSTADFPNPAVDHSDIQGFEPLMHIIDKIANGERVPPQITMQYEMLRFCTLRSYPKVNKPYITRLAQAGFYYANSADEVVCYCCARRKRNWQETDIPMDVHRQLNPNCKFLLKNSEVNVPVKTDGETSNRLSNLRASSNMPTMSSSPQGNTGQQGNHNGHHTNSSSEVNVSENTHQQQIALSSSTASGMSNRNEVQRDALVSSSQRSIAANDTLSRMQTRAHGNFVLASASSPVDNERRQHTTTSNKAFEHLAGGTGITTSQTSGGGTTQNAMPKYPKYSSKTVRVTSFTDCSEIVVSPESLSEAGFFYAGFGDCVRCFQCGVGLRHWSEEDDPWIEHSRWSKDCSFVRQMRGQEFVNLVQMAVQYSQHQSNQQNNGQRPSETTAESNQGGNGGDEVENLMHADSAQSVLEMGYHPDLIRRAIRTVLAGNGRQNVTAATLMEKIFEIEAENPTIAEQNGEVVAHNDQSAVAAAAASQQTAPSTSEEQASGTGSDHSESHRPGGAQQPIKAKRQNAATAEHTRTSIEEPSVPTFSEGREMTKTTKKSQQLLEQKRLKEENEKLKQQSICTKCKEKDVCIVFLPCGHLVTCETCAPTVRYCTMQSCGKYIKGTVRTYLA